MSINSFEDIESWQLGRVISQRIDELSRNSPLKQDFPLLDQMSRSSGSIMDNVAEGFDSGSNAEFIRFLWYSKRSCTELQSQLYRALDRKHCDPKSFNEIYALAETAKSKLGGFIAYLTSTPDPREAKKRLAAKSRNAPQKQNNPSEP